MGESYQYKSPSTILPINPLEGPINIDNEETYISIDVLNTVSSRRNAMSSVQMSILQEIADGSRNL